MPAQVWSLAGLGGTLGTPMLSERLRFSAYGAMRFAQFVKIEAKFGPNKTDRLDFKKVGKVAQQGRVHAEGEPVQETTLTFYSDSVFTQEITNSVSFTDRVEEYAKLSIRSGIIQRLKDDAASVLDILYASAFQSADVVYTPTGTTPNPTFTVSTTAAAGATASRNIQSDDIKNLSDLMKSTYKAPAWDAEGRFVMVASTQAMRGLKDSRDLIDASKYGAPERLFYGEAGLWYNTRFCEENNVLGSNLGSNANMGEAIFFGDDAVIEVVAKPLQLQAKVGVWERDRGIRYVTWLGVKRTWFFSEAGQVRVIRIYSN